ncbi:HAD family hydrolase [Prauserella cavernicola]|uniref:HAD family hydrolase n=1 Tax=Prauserella cavernicola TaxID=2800127 RepID=A0A934V5U5_9PSEU|nr:HAD family hydrolase [Prauserella cavernicola]MBK1786867.1 HAD family hydrolase [Prauserella cavernicola]
MAFALGSPTAPQTGSDRDDDAPPWVPPELRLVCLDIDDTLIDFTAAGRRSLEALIGSADAWHHWELVTDAYVAKVVSGELDYAEMHARRTQAFLAERGTNVGLAEAAELETRRKELLRESWRLFDDVLPCLEWLVAAGVRVAAVTNASGDHQRDKLAGLGLARFFDYVAIAGEMGVAKPDQVMFHSVCFKLDCEPSEAVHIGDKLRTDAIGARDAGLGGVWLDRTESAEDVPPGVHVISSLTELPELLVSEFVRVGVPAQR